MKRYNWILGTALSLCLPGIALAQDNEPDEIIVTAQKRAENVQDVPISIQVMTPETLESLAADSIGDIDNFVPGLEVGSGSPTQPRYAIRGISTSDFGVGTDPAVGIYVDGVYSGRSGSSLLAFNDVERVEVVKGPQGTLFGRNSAAGAVSIVTRKPSQEFETALGVRVGNFGKERFEGLVNVPVSETVALRVNGVYNRRDGLFVDAATGEDLNIQNNWAVKAALGWDLTPKTNLLLRYTHDEIDQDARPAISVVPYNDFPNPGAPPIPTNPAEYLDPREVPIANDVINNSETRNLDEVTLTISHDLGKMDLTSITSYREFQTNNREDEDGTNRVDLYFDTNNIEDNESFYQEFRLTGATDNIAWLAGVSYFDETAFQTSSGNTNSNAVDTVLLSTEGARFITIVQLFNDIFGVPANLLGHSWQEDMNNRGDNKAYAAFADVTWEVSPVVSLTVGGRYTRDEKTFSWFNDRRYAPSFDENLLLSEGIINALGGSVDDFLVDFVFIQDGLAGVPCDNGVTVAEGVECILEDTFNDFSPRVVLDFKPSDSTLLYASFAQGYKAGGYNSVEVASRFDNEDVDNFEAGFKTTIPDFNLRLNGSVFHYKYKNKQSVSLVSADQLPGSNVPQYLVSTSDEQATGLDLEGYWPISDGLTLMGNMQLIDQTYKSRVNRDGTDLRGEPTGEPKLSYAVGARYEIPTKSLGSFDLQVMHSFRGASRCNSFAVTQGTCGGEYRNFEVGTSRKRTDLRAWWHEPSGHVQIGAFVNNAFDNVYVNGINNLTTDVFGTPFASISEPRFYGFDFKFKY